MQKSKLKARAKKGRAILVQKSVVNSTVAPHFSASFVAAKGAQPFVSGKQITKAIKEKRKEIPGPQNSREIARLYTQLRFITPNNL